MVGVAALPAKVTALADIVGAASCFPTERLARAPGENDRWPASPPELQRPRGCQSGSTQWELCQSLRLPNLAKIFREPADVNGAPRSEVNSKSVPAHSSR
jgi:hypothetical protein